jgi:hypothetical protein
MLLLIGLTIYSLVQWIGGANEAKIWGRETLRNLGLEL